MRNNVLIFNDFKSLLQFNPKIETFFNQVFIWYLFLRLFILYVVFLYFKKWQEDNWLDSSRHQYCEKVKAGEGSRRRRTLKTVTRWRVWAWNGSWSVHTNSKRLFGDKLRNLCMDYMLEDIKESFIWLCVIMVSFPFYFSTCLKFFVNAKET